MLSKFTMLTLLMVVEKKKLEEKNLEQVKKNRF